MPKRPPQPRLDAGSAHTVVYARVDVLVADDRVAGLGDAGEETDVGVEA